LNDNFEFPHWAVILRWFSKSEMKSIHRSPGVIALNDFRKAKPILNSITGKSSISGKK